MKQELIDGLETLLSETRHGFEYEPLIEAVANDDSNNIARYIHLILFGDDKLILSNRNALLEAFARYYNMDDNNADVIDYNEKAYGDFSPEREIKLT